MSYYSDLNVLPTATMDDIKLSYQRILKKNLSQDQKIIYNKAFVTLYDYTSRKKYDKLMEENSKNVLGYNYENSYLDIYNLDNLISNGIFVRMPFTSPENRCIRVSAGTDEDINLFEERFPKALKEAKIFFNY